MELVRTAHRQLVIVKTSGQFECLVGRALRLEGREHASVCNVSVEERVRGPSLKHSMRRWFSAARPSSCTHAVEPQPQAWDVLVGHEIGTLSVQCSCGSSAAQIHIIGLSQRARDDKTIERRSWAIVAVRVAASGRSLIPSFEVFKAI